MPERRPPVWQEWVRTQLTDEVGLWNQDARLGWVSRRLLFGLARLETDEAVSDRSTVRGSCYSRLITAVVSSGDCYGFERTWAESIMVARAVVEGPVAPGEAVYGGIRVRRLLETPWDLQVEMLPFRIRCSPYPLDVVSSGSGYRPAMTTEQRIAAAAWDNQGRIISEHPPDAGWGPLRLGVATDRGDGTAAIRTSLIAFEASRWGDTITDRVIGRPIWIDTDVEIDASRTPTMDGSVVLKSAIESAVRARLTKRYSKSLRRWLPVVLFDLPGNQPPPDGASLLFGGRASVVVVWTLGSTRYESIELETDRGWWLWDTFEPPIPEGGVSSELDAATLDWHRSRNGQLSGLSHRGGRWLGDAEPRGGVVNYEGSPHRIVVRLQNPSPSGPLDFAGLWGERVYAGDLEFDLPGWTIEELRQFVVNGIVPDHAMP